MKLRIVSDGTAGGTAVFVGENQLGGIEVISWSADISGVRALLEVRDVECDILVDAQLLDADWQPHKLEEPSG